MSKVKICGLTREADIIAVNAAMPDYIGFVFATSKRKIEAQTAAALKEKLNPQIKTIGVFVNEDIDKITDIYKNKIIDIVQLHGDEDDTYIKKLKENCGCRIIKAIGIHDKLPPLPKNADYILFDTLTPQRGGTGKPFDWDIIKNYNNTIPYFLAGGMTTQNVKKAIDTLAPYCIDVSSGVETNGFKDAEKIKEFVNTCRGGQQKSEDEPRSPLR